VNAGALLNFSIAGFPEPQNPGSLHTGKVGVVGSGLAFDIRKGNLPVAGQ